MRLSYWKADMFLQCADDISLAYISSVFMNETSIHIYWVY